MPNSNRGANIGEPVGIKNDYEKSVGIIANNPIPSRQRFFNVHKRQNSMSTLGKIAISAALGVAVYQLLKVKSVRKSLVDVVVDGSVYLIKRKLLG